eukprot:Colp12_sorted_trinity150504_noHs@5774
MGKMFPSILINSPCAVFSGRGHEIETENRKLLQKLVEICRSKSKLDCRNDYIPRSLNRAQRQQTNMKITYENQALLERLENKQPHYSHVQFEKEYLHNRRYYGQVRSCTHTVDLCTRTNFRL